MPLLLPISSDLIDDALQSFTQASTVVTGENFPLTRTVRFWQGRQNRCGSSRKTLDPRHPRGKWRLGYSQCKTVLIRM